MRNITRSSAGPSPFPAARISPINDIHILFFGIGQGGKFSFAIALTFIALYAAVHG